MTDLSSELARLPQPRSRWVVPGRHREAASADVADALLAELDDTDRMLFELFYGLGLDLGTVSYVARVDPAVAVWRLERRLSARAPDPEEAAALERALAERLGPGPAEACVSPTAAHIDDCVRCRAARLPEEHRRRLVARLVPSTEARADFASAGGIGIGSILLVLGVVVSLALVGAVRDEDPLYRGRHLVRSGEFERGREALSDALRRSTARERRTQAQFEILVSWLAEGRFDRAVEWIDASPEMVDAIGRFLPGRESPETPVWGRHGHALLPRGRLTTPRPAFVVAGGPAGWLSLSVGPQRDLVLELEATDDDVVEIAYPEAWPSLPSGPALWSVTRGGEEPGDAVPIHVLDPDERARIRERHARILTNYVARPARVFLRAYAYEANGLLTQAGFQFADLAHTFPEADYPGRELRRLAGALGVDASAFMQ